MALTRREERALLGEAAHALVARTHYPDLAAIPLAELREIAQRLRADHAKLRDLLREGRRARRGKGEARAASNAEAGRAARRKQVYAAALKRVNGRFADLGGAAAD